MVDARQSVEHHRSPKDVVLHLVHPAEARTEPAVSLRRSRPQMGSDAGLAACNAVIRATPWLEHRVMVFGGDDAGRTAAQLGLAAHGRIAPPFGRVELGGPALRRWLEAEGEPRVIHGWGTEFAGLRARVASVARQGPPAMWCVADMERGLLDSRTGHWPPAISPMAPWIGGPLTGERRDAGSTGGGPRALLLGDAPSSCDALAFVYLLGVLHVAGLRITAMVPRTAARLDRALRHIRAGGYVYRMEILDGPPLAALCRCELAVCAPTLEGLEEPFEPTFGDRLAIAIAARRGFPVVMPDGAWARSFLPRNGQGFLTNSEDPAGLARVVGKLLAGDVRVSGEELRTGLRSPGRGLEEDVVQAWGLKSGVRSEAP
jgi:hypothetical protein